MIIHSKIKYHALPEFAVVSSRETGQKITNTALETVSFNKSKRMIGNESYDVNVKPANIRTTSEAR